MTKQLAILFDKDGSDSVFAGYVVETEYDASKGHVIIHLEKLITHATLQVAFDNAGIKNINENFLSLAASSDFETKYYKRRLQNKIEEMDRYRSKIHVLERQVEILERRIQSITQQP